MLSLCEKMQEMIQFTKGCTEPAAIALNAAYAGKHLKNADEIVLDIDKMTFKNAYSAGIPNAKGNIGVTFAVIFGYLIADTEKELEIFDKLDDEIIKTAKEMYKKVTINVIDKNEMFIKTTAYKGSLDKASATTNISHTHITNVEINGQNIIEKDSISREVVSFEREFYDTDNWTVFIEEMYKDINLREKMENALKTNISTLKSSIAYNKNDSTFSSVYARMNGDKIRVASCAGSGNKGLTALITPFEYGKIKGSSDEKILKAELLSCFVTSLITSKLGFISSVCGVVHAAAVGAMAAVLYLQDNLELFSDAFNNYIVAKSGVICDGAKKSCAMKAAGAVGTAYKSIDFAKEGIVMDYRDGILGRTFYDTVKNLEKYKEVFGMFDMKTIDILKNK